ncbi:NAD-dependent succinate-semialdehyde dehydrogenase [Kaustia mangrovi]|uniref:NAD-dependent succinate-semialdehyde dehydrogenase n=1 Tax=Kaustia mangrovi TaxID=2593653 RepID=A0A7S8C7M5_9HYPH|nr:NAD-dependent succinate-semialdehyde dehydrogenase [Kaustia mangrovi]QPC44842.1 NAD-dependent succinate-semialdehyde dehydrogenase [Kaustia mangrovi]
MDFLNDKSLFKDKSYIGGEWVGGAKTFEVKNPATGEVLASVPDFGAEETRGAIEAANAAFKGWAALTARERYLILRRWFELIMENQDDIARLMTAEMGKPLTESRGEVAYAASFVEFYAEEAKRVYGETIPSPKADARVVVIRQPIGVVGAITPWNFPAAMITRKVAPAFAAGCTAVCKPAEDTPLTALALAELAERAGFPKGVLNIVTGSAASAPAIGEELTTSPLVRAIGFTGSTEVGKLLMRQSASTVKKVALELGGNAPFIVFDDADLDAAVAGAMASKFRNAGQTCVCANRILVQDGIYDAFAERLASEVLKFKVGDGMEVGVNIGPLINEQAIEKVERHVADAVANGGEVVVGGHRHELGGNFYEPTVIRNVTTRMLVTNEETFGPVAPLFRFKEEDEAVAMANDTPFGLAAYFFSRDIGRCWRVAEGLEYGMVGVNEGILSGETVPFGGIKESGLGREGSHHGIEEFTELKYMLMGGLGR